MRRKARPRVVESQSGPDDYYVVVQDTSEFRAHFEDGRADADVPPFVGTGLMSDGDQTKSESSADFADFILSW